MRRFIVTYRWELWLLLWAPLLSGLLASAILTLAAFFGDRGWMYPPYFFYAGGAVWSLMLTGLLLVFYGRARRLERGFLTLVWGYALGLAAIGALVWLAAAAFSPDNEGSGLLTWTLWTRGRFLAHGIAALLLLYRFARRASQFSLAHAFFLFLVVKTYTPATILGSTLDIRLSELAPIGLQIAIGFASVFGVGFLLAWLLGNFDPRGAIFRKWAVVGLLAAYMVSALWELVEFVTAALDSGAELFTVPAFTYIGLFLFPSSVIVPLALIYLVRVRDPVPAPEAEPPADLRVQ